MLTSEILRRVREIQVRTGRQVADVLAGEYVSVFKGRGMEFDEVRPYVPGDDVRSIDWNVTARTGEPYVKRYVEERQLTLMLMADVSASQDFGSVSRSKREATAELCALLAFSATRNDDKVGLALFHSEIEEFIPPRKGQKHALRVVRDVLAHSDEQDRRALFEASGAQDASLAERLKAWWRRFATGRRPRRAREATDVGFALEFLMRVTKRRTICFVVSDFLDDGFERAMVAANRKHDVIAVLVTDPNELEVPDVGLVALRDAETGEARVVDTGSSAFRQEARTRTESRIKELELRFASLGIDFIHVDAAGDVIDPLVRFFRMRERRGRR
ncbi:MAG: DUF58 domain-containing protein [bacterium]|nr:DUF58 domain-containing protein [Deltaproteobacteria bacterium]MCP4906767.1 DUF58 domain-containing protein [bacterium]